MQVWHKHVYEYCDAAISKHFRSRVVLVFCCPNVRHLQLREKCPFLSFLEIIGHLDADYKNTVPVEERVLFLLRPFFVSLSLLFPLLLRTETHDITIRYLLPYLSLYINASLPHICHCTCNVKREVLVSLRGIAILYSVLVQTF